MSHHSPYPHLQLKHRGVDDLSPMALEAADDGVEDFLPDGCLLGAVVPGALRAQTKGKWVRNVKSEEL